jgi:hypothetical protein
MDDAQLNDKLLCLMKFDSVMYRVIKKSLCTWLQYRKLQTVFKMSPASLQTFIGTRLTLTPSVIPNSNYVIMVTDWNCLKYFCVFLYCNNQVRRDFLIALDNVTSFVPLTNYCCSVKAISITYFECLVYSIQWTCVILCSVTYPALQCFSTLSNKRHDFLKTLTEHKTCFDFLYRFCWKISHSKKN